MGRNRFVVPEKVRIPLSDGDWIEVKKRLSVGEARTAMASFIGTYRPDGSRTPNAETLGMGQVIAYLIAWSFRDAEDRPVDLNVDAIKALDLPTYGEIETAISKHIENVEREDAERDSTAQGPIALVASRTS